MPKEKITIGWFYGTQDWAFKNLCEELMRHLPEFDHKINQSGDINFLVDPRQLETLGNIDNILLHIDSNRWLKG